MNKYDTLTFIRHKLVEGQGEMKGANGMKEIFTKIYKKNLWGALSRYQGRVHLLRKQGHLSSSYPF